MNKVRNFEKILDEHNANEYKLQSATNSFAQAFDSLPFLNLLAYYIKRKFENTKELEKLNVRDTAQTLVRLAKSKSVILPQDKAEAMVKTAISIYTKNPEMPGVWGFTGGLIGLIVGGWAGLMAGSSFGMPIEGALGGGLLGATAGGFGGYGYSKLTSYDKPTYEKVINQFLKKAAEKVKTPELKKKLRYSDYDPGATMGTTSAIAGVGGTVGSMVAGESSMGLVNKPGATTKGTVRRFLKDNPQLGVTFSPHKQNKGLKGVSDVWHLVGIPRKFKKDKSNPYYFPTKAFGAKYNYINSPVRNLDVAMHELGHAKDLARRSKLGLIAPNLIAPIAGTAWTYKMLQNEDTVKYAPAGAIVGMAPTLLAEAQANRHGYNAIKKYQGKASANKFLKKIVTRNTGSYWAIPAALGAGSYLAGRLMHKNIRHEQKMGRPIPYRTSIEELTARVDRNATSKR